MKNRYKILALLCVVSMAVSGLSGCAKEESKASQTADSKEETEKFTPSLDTKASASLEIAGGLGNFEALDQVVNDFNEIYPNVTVTYEQNDQKQLVEYVKNNSYVDIFMTSDDNVRAKDQKDMYVYEQCLDLAEAGIDLSAVDPELVKVCTIDDRMVRLPLAKLMCGLAVNTTLLEKENLEIPQTYAEFLKVCEALKKKGYTPLQSSKYHACSDLVLPMGMSLLGNDEALTEKIKAGDTSYAEALTPVYERLGELLEKGYIDNTVNETFPDDNYDGAILKFFEGDVPFWVTTTESFSGMKKRESKSEAFTAEPFDYEFINAPLGDEGTYDYEEPWYGFSVNKDSDALDYAVEFMKFLAQPEELDKLAEVKGMPSVTLQNTDPRFEKALGAQKTAGRYVYNGDIGGTVTSAICDSANQFGRAELKTVDDVIQAIRDRGL